MSSTNADNRTLTVGTVTQTIPESYTQKPVHGVPDAALTVRDLVVVAALGGIWYLLSKIALDFAVGH